MYHSEVNKNSYNDFNIGSFSNVLQLLDIANGYIFRIDYAVKIIKTLHDVYYVFKIILLKKLIYLMYSIILFSFSS